MVPAGSAPVSPVCFDVQSILFDDDVVESTESFLIGIMETSPPEVEINSGNSQVFIQDKDGMQKAII